VLVQRWWGIGGIYASEKTGPKNGPQIQTKNQGKDEEKGRQEKEEVTH
jgi:hypothetical protein